MHHLLVFNFIKKTLKCLSVTFVALVCFTASEATPDTKSSSEIEALKTELLVADTEERAIQQAHRLLERYEGTSMEPDLQLRLADLHIRRARTDRFLQFHRKSQEIISIAPDVVRGAEPRRHIRQAISIYDEIERRWPNFGRLDEVLFNNAFSNQQIANDRKAKRHFEKLIRTFERSHLIPDAHLALGEMEFQGQDFKKALSHFEAIKAYPDSAVYPYGLYKAGWSHYNLQDAQSGLKELEEVVKYGRFVQEQGIDSRLDLRREALFDMALFFSDVYPSREAYRYLSRQAAEIDVSPYIIRLAELYKSHSKNEDTRVVLTDFIQNKPYSDHIPTAYLEIMDASEKLGRRSDIVRLMKSMQQVCDLGSRWSQRQVGLSETNPDGALARLAMNYDQEEMTPSFVCQESFNTASLRYITRWLREWNNDNSKTDLAGLIEQAYDTYLKTDNKTDEANRARFIYAEFLYNREKYKEASHHYEVAGGQAEDQKLGHDSRYAAIVALEKATEDTWSNRDEAHLRRLATAYLGAHPEGKYALDLQFKLAFIAYDKKRYDEAAPQLLELGQSHRQHKLGIKAQDLYLDVLNIQNNFEALKQYSNEFRANIKDTERLEKLNQIYEESYFSLVQSQEDRGRYRQAIEGYTEFAKENPKSALTEKALLNVIELYYKVDDLAQGAAAALTYFANYPKNEKSIDVLVKAAQTYESMGLLKEATGVLQKLTQADSGNKEKWSLLSAEFMMLYGDYRGAKSIYSNYLGSQDSENALISLVKLKEIAEKERNKGKTEEYLTKIMDKGKEPHASKARLYFVNKHWENKEYPEAFRMAGAIVGARNRDIHPSTKAQARFIQAKILDHEFRTQSLRSRLERVHLVLQLKTEKLGKAQEAYQAAASYGDAEITVEALTALAEAYQYYSNAVRAMPLPTGVPEEEEVIFRNEINRLALPMEDKAVDTMRMALQRADSYRINPHRHREIQDRLQELTHQFQATSPFSSEISFELLLPNSDGVES